MDSQTSWESRSPKEDQKVGWGGWKLGKDGGKPILQVRKGKPSEGQGSARTQPRDGGVRASARGPSRLSPLGLQAGGGTRGHCAPSRNKWLAPGDVLGPI